MQLEDGLVIEFTLNLNVDPTARVDATDKVAVTALPELVQVIPERFETVLHATEPGTVTSEGIVKYKILSVYKGQLVTTVIRISPVAPLVELDKEANTEFNELVEDI